MSNVTIREIIALCAAEFGVTPDDIRENFGGKQFRREFTLKQLAARDVAIYLIRRHTEWSWRKCAPLFGIVGNDAWSYAPERIRSNIAASALFGSRIDALEDRIDAIHERRMAELSHAEQMRAVPTSDFGKARDDQRGRGEHGGAKIYAFPLLPKSDGNASGEIRR